MLDFDKFDGFEWNNGNIHKNWENHNVAFFECEEVFLNKPLLLFDDAKHSASEKRYFAFGKNNSGRRLYVVFTIRHNKIRIISARDMNNKERKIYEKC
jgi:uncharacterized protein